MMPIIPNICLGLWQTMWSGRGFWAIHQPIKLKMIYGLWRWEHNFPNYKASLTWEEICTTHFFLLGTNFLLLGCIHTLSMRLNCTNPILSLLITIRWNWSSWFVFFCVIRHVTCLATRMRPLQHPQRCCLDLPVTYLTTLFASVCLQCTVSMA